MRPALTIAGMELKLFVRDRSNIFFAFIFPLFLVAMIGLQFGEGANAGRVAVVGAGGPLQERLVDELDRQDLVVSDPTWDEALTRLARGRLDVAVRVTPQAEEDAEAGDAVRLEVVRGSATSAQVAEQGLRAAVAAVRSEQEQLTALEERGVPAARAQDALVEARAQVARPRVEVVSTDEVSKEFDEVGQYDFGAAGQLLLFVFLTALTGATTMIQARRYGVVRRMLTAPVTSTQVVAGTVLGRWVLGLFQGGYIMAASSLLFGVQWGNLPTALLVLAVFALVAAGAAILLGTLLQSEGPAVGVGVGAGLVLAALGGSMFPLELFPDTMRTVAYAVPHSWAYEAFADVQRRQGTVVDVLPELGVLAAMAVVLVGLAAWSLRRSLARAM